MSDFDKLLASGDLRSIGNSNTIVKLVKNKNDFDRLFKLLFHENRLIIMRAADAIEKLTRHHPEYIQSHSIQIIALSKTVKHKELQWHLALLLSRINLNEIEFNEAVDILINWLENKNNSKIVRVNSMQALFELSKINIPLQKKLQNLFIRLEKENIPSINARIQKLKLLK